jgi:hypothetical protein
VVADVFVSIDGHFSISTPRTAIRTITTIIP